MTCRDCKHWDREKAMDKGGRIRSTYVAQCLWRVPVFPSAYTSQQKTLSLRSAPYTSPNSHADCPTFEKREES